jgi:hypothetical protein
MEYATTTIAVLLPPGNHRTFSLWYATVCIAVVCDFAGTISNYHLYLNLSLSLSLLLQFHLCTIASLGFHCLDFVAIALIGRAFAFPSRLGFVAVTFV